MYLTASIAASPFASDLLLTQGELALRPLWLPGLVLCSMLLLLAFAKLGRIALLRRVLTDGSLSDEVADGLVTTLSSVRITQNSTPYRETSQPPKEESLLAGGLQGAARHLVMVKREQTGWWSALATEALLSLFLPLTRSSLAIGQVQSLRLRESLRDHARGVLPSHLEREYSSASLLVIRASIAFGLLASGSALFL